MIVDQASEPSGRDIEEYVNGTGRMPSQTLCTAYRRQLPDAITFLSESHSANSGIPSVSFWMRSALRTPNHKSYCHCCWCMPELDGKTLLLKTSHVLDTGHWETSKWNKSQKRNKTRTSQEAQKLTRLIRSLQSLYKQWTIARNGGSSVVLPTSWAGDPGVQLLWEVIGIGMGFWGYDCLWVTYSNSI